MDYKYIEQLMERYFNAETSLEEESILRSFFSQENIPAEMQQWRALFTAGADETLGDDFDARIMEAISADSDRTAQAADSQTPVVKARVATLTQRLMPLVRAAAVIAVILTIGGALQAPWDSSWNEPVDYASIQRQDSVEAVSPVQAENISDKITDSTSVMLPALPKD